MKSTRRVFVQSAAAAAAALSGGCSSMRLFEGRKPAKIIDTHVHFYDPTRPQGVAWPPKEDQKLYRPTYPDDYRKLAVPQPADGVIAVETSPWVEDNQWLLDLAAKDKLVVGVVGNLLVGTDLFGEHLKRFAANPLYRGVRVRSGTLSMYLRDRAFLRDMGELAERGLCFDVHSPPAWVGHAASLSRAVPKLRLVVNHVASVTVNGQPPPEAWVDLMSKLAERPNIYMKVSGLVEGTGRRTGDAPAKRSLYRPVLDTLWETFGPERLIYASNWPVSERFAPLSTVEQIVLDYFSSKGQAALDQVFWRNAQKAYGLS